MSNNNDLGYMIELIWYMELRTKAQMKGIDVLIEVNESETLHSGLESDNSSYNYAVVKYIGDISFAINKDGDLYLDYYNEGISRFPSICYRYSFSEAEEIVKNYNENIVNMPKFYGFVRQYKDEPREILDYQVMLLNHFAERNGIKYETISGCYGGNAETEIEYLRNKDSLSSIDKLYYSCKEFFEDMNENNGILCIASRSRLDGAFWVWRQAADIITVGSFQYKCANIMEYQEYKPEEKNECIPENMPEQEQ
ncbi:MAG: hypothetical protein K2K21_09635 [Lachnospiraceae bacterium]|nr:hypothetical protein [Lachnospiraceae bacterium]